MKIDWLSKLTNFLQTMAFCLAVSAIQFAIQPERTYELPLVYSICIGTFIWAFIDFGRHLFTGTSDSGWPAGPAAVLLPMGAITGGFILGTLAGDAWFGWSSWGRPARAQLPVSIIITGIAGIVATYYFFSRSRPNTWHARCRRPAARHPRPSSNCWKHSSSPTCCSTRWPICGC